MKYLDKHQSLRFTPNRAGNAETKRNVAVKQI